MLRSLCDNPAQRRSLGRTALIVACLTTPAAAGDSTIEPSAIRSLVRAEAAATISSELVARLIRIPFKTGQSFRAGDVLIAFDCRRYAADLRAAEAEVKTHEIQVETNRQLLQHRAVGANELALAEARHGQALASADSLRVRTSQCVIVAPYDGRVAERFVDEFEMPQMNAPLLKIVKDGRLEVDIIVPSRWSVWLKPGHAFELRLDETGTTHSVHLQRMGAVIDPVSRTMKATGVMLDPSPDVRPGMSGVANIRPPAREAN